MNLDPKNHEKSSKNAQKRGGKFFFEIFLLRIVPKVLGQVWVQKSKKKNFFKYRLGAIEEKWFFWEKF